MQGHFNGLEMTVRDVFIAAIQTAPDFDQRRPRSAPNRASAALAAFSDASAAPVSSPIRPAHSQRQAGRSMPPDKKADGTKSTGLVLGQSSTASIQFDPPTRSGRLHCRCRL
jgi:hypothetical protein